MEAVLLLQELPRQAVLVQQALIPVGGTDNLTSNGDSFVTARITPASRASVAGIDTSGATDNLTNNGGSFVTARITPASSGGAAALISVEVPTT